MNSKGALPMCSHERRRLDILSLLQEVNQEKNELQCEIDDINNQSQEITDFFDQYSELPLHILDTLQEKQEVLEDEVERLEYMMDELESKDAEYAEEYDDEKKEAMEEKCSCVDNFKLL